MTTPYESAFTWPNNPDTHYVDPAKYDGVYARFTDITDGTLGSGITIEGVIEKVSKFNQSYFADSFSAQGINASRKAYNGTPLVTAGMALHSFTCTAIESLSPLRITTNNPNGVYTGQKFKFTGVISDNSAIVTNMNNVEFYIKKIDDNTVELYYDSAITQAVDAQYWINTSETGSAGTGDTKVFFKVDSIDASGQPYFTMIVGNSGHYFHSGQTITLTGSNYYTNLNGKTYYIKKINDYVIQLYTDSALTQPLNVLTDSAWNMSNITGSATHTVSLTLGDVPTEYNTYQTKAIMRVRCAQPHNLIAGVHDVAPALPIKFTARTSTYEFPAGTFVTGDTSYINLDPSRTFYAKVINETDLDLYSDATLVTPVLQEDINFKNVGGKLTVGNVYRTFDYIEDRNPVRVRLNTLTPFPINAVNGDQLQFGTNSFGLDTNTIYYGKKINDYTVEVYTDPALTTSLSIDNIGIDAAGNYMQGELVSKYFANSSQVVTDPSAPSYKALLLTSAESNELAMADGQAIVKTSGNYTTTNPQYYYVKKTHTDGSGNTYYGIYTDSTLLTRISAPVPGVGSEYTIRSYARITRLKVFEAIYSAGTTRSTDKISVVSGHINPATLAVVGTFDKPAIIASGYTLYRGWIGDHWQAFGSNYLNDAFTGTPVPTYTYANTVPQEYVVAWKNVNGAVDINLFTVAFGNTVKYGFVDFPVSTESHRNLGLIAVEDPDNQLVDGLPSYWQLPANYFYQLNNNGVFTLDVVRSYTRHGVLIKLIQTGQANVGTPQPLGTLQVDGDGGSYSKTYTWNFDNKIYADVYYPMVSNTEWSVRSGLPLTITSNYLGTILPAGNYWAVYRRTDGVFGRNQIEFKFRVDGESYINATSVYDSYPYDNYSLDPITGVASGSISLKSISGPNNIVANTTAVLRNGTGITITGSTHSELNGNSYYVKYITSGAGTTSYGIYTDFALTTPATVITTVPTLGASAPVSSTSIYPYKMTTPTIWYYGRSVYKRYNETLPGYENSVKVTGFTARAGISNGWGNYPTLNITQDVAGHITGISINAADPGMFANEAEVAINFANGDNIGNLPGTYFDPELGIFDTKDEWASTSYSAGKVWPTHKMPTSATIRTEQPTRITTSQSMQRYARSSGNIRYSIDLEYAPMHADEFAVFRSVIEAMQGQLVPVMLPLDVVLKDPLQTVSNANLFTNTQVPTTKSVLNIEGLNASDEQAIRQGQFIQILDTDIAPNGGIAVALHDAASNSWGETAVRITHPLRSVLDEYTDVNLRPDYVVVTMNTDSTEYNVSTSLHYTLKVSFILQGWA